MLQKIKARVVDRYQNARGLFWGECALLALSLVLLAVWLPCGREGRSAGGATWARVPIAVSRAAAKGLTVRCFKLRLFRGSLTLAGTPARATELVWVGCSRRSHPRLLATRLSGIRAYHGGTRYRPNYIAPLIYGVRINGVDVRLADAKPLTTGVPGWELRISAAPWLENTGGWRVSGFLGHYSSDELRGKPTSISVAIMEDKQHGR